MYHKNDKCNNKWTDKNFAKNLSLLSVIEADSQSVELFAYQLTNEVWYKEKNILCHSCVN